MQNSLPPIEFLTSRPAWREPYWEKYLVRFDNGQWSAKKLFVVGITCQFYRLSRDKRWYYISSLGNGTFLGKLGQPKLRKVDDRLLNACFSPNNRYLLGTNHFGGGLVLFDLEQSKKYNLVREREDISPNLNYFFWFGWYPDSRHIWYAVPSEYVDPKYVPPFYRIDLFTGKKRRLSPQEVDYLRTAWGIMDERYAEFPLRWYEDSHWAYSPRWVYSPNRRVRVRVIGSRWRKEVTPEGYVVIREDPMPGRPQVVLEWQDGRSEVLIEKDSHNWTEIFPIDVTSDGRWVFCLGHHPEWKIVEYGGKVRTTYHEIVIIDTRTKRIELLISEAPGFGQISGSIYTMWFGEAENKEGKG